MTTAQDDLYISEDSNTLIIKTGSMYNHKTCRYDILKMPLVFKYRNDAWEQIGRLPDDYAETYVSRGTCGLLTGYYWGCNPCSNRPKWDTVVNFGRKPCVSEYDQLEVSRDGNIIVGYASSYKPNQDSYVNSVSGKIDIFIYDESLNDGQGGYKKRCQPIWGYENGLNFIDKISINETGDIIAVEQKTSNVTSIVIVTYNQFAYSGNGGYIQLGRNIINNTSLGAISNAGFRVTNSTGQQVYQYVNSTSMWVLYSNSNSNYKPEPDLYYKDTDFKWTADTQSRFHQGTTESISANGLPYGLYSTDIYDGYPNPVSQKYALVKTFIESTKPSYKYLDKYVDASPPLYLSIDDTLSHELINISSVQDSNDGFSAFPIEQSASPGEFCYNKIEYPVDDSGFEIIRTFIAYLPGASYGKYPWADWTLHPDYTITITGEFVGSNNIIFKSDNLTQCLTGYRFVENNIDVYRFFDEPLSCEDVCSYFTVTIPEGVVEPRNINTGRGDDVLANQTSTLHFYLYETDSNGHPIFRGTLNPTDEYSLQQSDYKIYLNKQYQTIPDTNIKEWSNRADTHWKFVNGDRSYNTLFTSDSTLDFCNPHTTTGWNENLTFECRGEMDYVAPPSPTPSPSNTSSPTHIPTPTYTPSPSPTVNIIECCEDGMTTKTILINTETEFGSPTITATAFTINAEVCVDVSNGGLPYSVKLKLSNVIIGVLTTTGGMTGTIYVKNTDTGVCYTGIIVDDECSLTILS